MTKKVVSIKVIDNIVYVYFSDGSHGIRRHNGMEWVSVNLTADELAAAKRVGCPHSIWRRWEIAPQRKIKEGKL